MNLKAIGKLAIAFFESSLLFSCSGEGSSNSSIRRQDDSETIETPDVVSDGADSNFGTDDINIGNIDDDTDENADVDIGDVGNVRSGSIIALEGEAEGARAGNNEIGNTSDDN